MAGPSPDRVGGGGHLAALSADVDAVAARLAAVPAPARRAQAAVARRESARLSARLDASTLTDATATEVDQRLANGMAPVDGAADGVSPAARLVAGWAQTLKVDALATQEVAAVEYANLLACFDAEPDLAGVLADRPRAVLAELHTLVCRGLVDGAVAGRPRRTEQAVHDGAQGRVLYRAAPPGRLDGLLDGLAAWLTGPAETQPAVVVAGVVHGRILEWQPFEAANGRVARAASRLVLRARGVDPEGLAVAERLAAADPLAYHREVAASIHRGDLGLWLERAAESVLDALVTAAEAVDPGGAPDPPVRATAVAHGLGPGAAITLADYAEAAAVPRATCREDLRALVVAGWMAPEPGTHGLRYRRRGRVGRAPGRQG
ncbi:MAG: Fic family protein [Egibacteraceae bacterium]